MWHAGEWLGMVAVWVTFGYQIHSLVRARRRRREGEALLVATIAHEEELTPLQAQAALDAAAATFTARVAEMREANRAHG